MSPAYKARAIERKARLEKQQKEQEERARLHEVWKESLPEIPQSVVTVLEDSCETGMMEFLMMLESDPEAVSKLKAHAQYVLRDQAKTYNEDVEKLKNELAVKEKFVGTFSEIQEIFNKLPKPKKLTKAQEALAKKGKLCPECGEYLDDCDCDEIPLN